MNVSLPKLLLHIEGATILAVSALLYGQSGGSWLLFALLILAPDLSMLGYLAGNYLFVHPRNHFTVDPLFWSTLIAYAITVTIVIWFGVLARLVQRRKIVEARRQSEELLEQELADTKLLSDVSAELVREDLGRFL